MPWFYIQGDRSHRCDNLHEKVWDHITLAPRGAQLCPHIGSDLLGPNGILGGLLQQPSWRANPHALSPKTKPATCPFSVCGCFAFAWASSYSSVIAIGLHADSRHNTTEYFSIQESNRIAWVCFLLLSVICGWIKPLLICQSFPSHPSRWWGHDCGLIISALRWQALIGNSGYFIICKRT